MSPVDSQSPRLLFSAEEIAAKVDLPAGEIAETMPRDMMVIAILKGGFVSPPV